VYSVAGCSAQNLWLRGRRYARASRILRTAALVSPLAPLPIHSRDSHDERFLAVALGGNAEYLITGDDDLLVLQRDPCLETLQLVTARDYLPLLAQRGQHTLTPSGAGGASWHGTCGALQAWQGVGGRAGATRHSWRWSWKGGAPHGDGTSHVCI
jgi:hypothetical protein